MMALVLGEPQASVTSLQISVQAARQTDQTWTVPRRLALLGHARLLLGDHHQARQALIEAYEAAAKHDHMQDIPLFHATLVRLALRSGDYTAAAQFAAAMFSQLARTGAWVGISRNHFFDLALSELLAHTPDAQASSAWRAGTEMQAAEMTLFALGWLKAKMS